MSCAGKRRIREGCEADLPFSDLDRPDRAVENRPRTFKKKLKTERPAILLFFSGFLLFRTVH